MSVSENAISVPVSKFDDLERELQRCLRLLATRFPDPEFRECLPEIVIEDSYAPLPEECVRGGKIHSIVLHTRGHLNRSVEQVLTIMLHKAVHAANAFRWKRDCTSNSYHNSSFKKLAERIGFQVADSSKRYGLAHTTPSRPLLGVFRDVAVREELLLPFQDRFPKRYSRRFAWNCGLTRMPTRSELLALRSGPADDRSRRFKRGDLIRAATVNRTWQNEESVPMLRLSGKWLRNLGFHENCRFKIEACYGQLTIESRGSLIRYREGRVTIRRAGSSRRCLRD